MRKIISLLLSAVLVSLSMEPAFSQVRAIAAESFVSRVGPLALPGVSALTGGALSRSSSLILNNSAPSLASAPAWSAAGLPISAAASPASFAAASPAAAIVAVPAAAAASVPVAAVDAVASAAPFSSPSRRDGVSAENAAALPAGAPTAQPHPVSVSLEKLAASAEQDGGIYFDQAGRVASAPGVAGSANDETSRLEPPSKARSLRAKILWGTGALALPVLTFGWMSFLKSPAASAPSASAYSDWGAIARGIAFAGPLIILGVWEAAKLYRSKKEGSLPWMSRLPVAQDLHKPFMPRLQHYATNLAFGAIGIAMMAIFAGPHINDWNNFLNAHSIGLLHWLHVTGWKNVVAAITILDFMGWWWHYACHRFPVMWRLHKVHHSDLEYNFSTTYRTHWAEMAAEIAFRMAMYALVGPTLLAITIYELIILALSQYQHANIKMPARLEEFLSRYFMTSHKHFIHHSLDADDYDTNYGFIFAVWDKLFGTFKSYGPDHLSNKISTGIREYPRAQDLTFFKLLWMPFRSQDYPKKEKP